MKQFETRFKQVDVLPMVKHYMSSLDLYNLFNKYVPASNSCLAEHAESLCIISDLHKKVCKLLEVPSSAYKNLHDRWWLFEGI